jgi:2-polyprenyl-3-methyl-5-hydroxy-6-metoxy-1,4-benzoquinol methylase
MSLERILERIAYVHQKSQNKDSQIETKVSDSDIKDSQKLDSFVPEIDGNYSLFFNEIYTSTTRTILKKILKTIAWPILKRQVYFNAAIRQLLYNLIQKSYESAARNRNVDARFLDLEQKIAQIPEKAQKTQQLLLSETKLEITSQLESRLEQISTQLEESSKDSDKITDKVASVDRAKINSGLWFNEPIIVGYTEEGEAFWSGTNERIFEKSFVLQSLAQSYSSTQITVLDVGAAESLLAYELASLNYSVTAIDIRPIALSHPNLKFVKTDICKPVLSPASFDCVVALSTLEHIGLGWYGDEIGEMLDCEAVRQIHSLLKPDGSFILTVPYGKKAITPIHRIYDRETLNNLLKGFNITKAVYGIRLDDFTWTITNNEEEAASKEHDLHNYLPGSVAMLACQKTDRNL